MKVTIWINYGLEGWKPTDYDSEKEAIEAILKSGHYCNSIRITKELNLNITE